MFRAGCRSTRWFRLAAKWHWQVTISAFMLGWSPGVCFCVPFRSNEHGPPHHFFSALAPHEQSPEQEKAQICSKPRLGVSSPETSATPAEQHPWSERNKVTRTSVCAKRVHLFRHQSRGRWWSLSTQALSTQSVRWRQRLWKKNTHTLVSLITRCEQITDPVVSRIAMCTGQLCFLTRAYTDAFRPHATTRELAWPVALAAARCLLHPSTGFVLPHPLLSALRLVF